VLGRSGGNSRVAGHLGNPTAASRQRRLPLMRLLSPSHARPLSRMWSAAGRRSCEVSGWEIEWGGPQVFLLGQLLVERSAERGLDDELAVSVLRPRGRYHGAMCGASRRPRRAPPNTFFAIVEDRVL
jgi:hypothetical protein